MSEDRLVVRELTMERVVVADQVLVVQTPATHGPAGVTGPNGPGGPAGPQGPAGSPADVGALAALVEAEIAEYDEEGPSLVLLYENAKV